MYNVDGIFERYFKYRGSNQENTTIGYTHLFIKFLKAKGILVTEIRKSVLEEFKKHLLTLRDQQGFYWSALFISKNLICVKYFLNWLVRELLIKSNPVSELSEHAVLEEISRLIEERIAGNRKKNLNKYTDDYLIKLFLRHLKEKYLSKSILRRHEKGIEIFADFFQTQDKKLKDFKAEDFQKYQEYLYDFQIFNCIQISKGSFITYCFSLQKLYKWLYQEGYLEKDLLESWNTYVLRDYYKMKQEKEIEEKSKELNRYYTNKEVLVAYNKYLKRTYSHYSDYKHLLESFRFFARYLTSRNKGLYKVDEERIKDFKEYLYKYEYMPGRYYKGSFIARRLNHIKRFYDWFTRKGFIQMHPLSDFKFSKCVKEMEELCSKRDYKAQIKEAIPSQFKDVYAGVLEYERRIGLSEETINTHKRGWKEFFIYLDQNSIKEMKEVTEQDLNEFQHYLHEFRNPDKTPLSLNTRVKHLIALKRLYRYLAKFKYLERDLSNSIELPKNPKGLPTAGLKDQEVRRVIEKIDPGRANYIRDRALIETLYSTGARSNEIRSIRIDDIDLNRGLVRINHPKGGAGKQRVIPVGKIACIWIEKYIKEVRSRIKDLKSDILFVTNKGEKLNTGTLLMIVKSVIMKSGIRKPIVTHSWRVACATEMLRGKANIKYVQEQLGHSSIDSTEKYLRLEPIDLKIVHKHSHPRERKASKEAEFEEKVINL